MVLHYSQIAVFLKRRGISLFTNSTTLLLIMGVTIAVIIFYFIDLILPIDIIGEIKVTRKQKNICYYIFGAYLYVNIGFLFFLSIKNL